MIAAVPIARAALMPLRAGDQCLLRRDLPAVLIVEALQPRLVVLSLAAENDATPVARLSAAGSLFRCKDDRLCGRTLGDELAATLCDECRLGLLVALDDRSRLMVCT